MAQQKEPIKKPKQKPDTKPDWGGKCEVCGASPIVPATGMCAVCGDAIKPNPTVESPMDYCGIMKDGREYHPSSGRRSPLRRIQCEKLGNG